MKDRVPLADDPGNGVTVFDRRAFLRHVGGLGLGLAGAGIVGSVFGQAEADEVRPPSRGASRVFDTRVPPESDAPVLVTVHGGGPGEAVLRAVEALGGIGRFVKRGERVLVKPNIGWDRAPEQGANTNPEVVAALVRLCRDAGASRVVVSDVSCNEARRSFERSGIWRAAEDAGAEVVLPADGAFAEIRLGGGLGTWKVLRSVLEADRLLNVPVVKHHGSARLTAGMKNWYGVLGGDRGALHRRMDEGIAELAATFRPALTVLDATLVMLRNGPQGGRRGDVERRDLVAATVDPVAGDAWAAGLLGRTPDDVPYIALAQRAGLGTAQLADANRRAIEL